MAWQLVFTEQYNRRAARFLRLHQDAIGQYAKTLKLLQANPHHPSLRLRALKGKLAGLHSVSINLSCRITLEMLITESEIVPINVGDHDEVY
ncbi:MAG: plasmid stabilization protein [Thermodesulfobacteriota bacterium]